MSDGFGYKQDFSHLYTNDGPPSVGVTFVETQQETLRHLGDPSLMCYHGNGSHPW